MTTPTRVALATAAVVVVALLGYRYLVPPHVGAPEQTSSGSASAAAEIDASLPALSLPGTRGGPPGEYGWWATATLAGMHRVVGDAEATAMFFAAGPNCLEGHPLQHRVDVRVGGFAGVAVEPYLPAVMFNGVGDEITRAYALDVEGRTLCVFVTWHPTTSDRDREAAFEILESLRAEPAARDGIRITFTLRDEWDTG